MVGIYKITSPTGRVYIGQSWNIKNRWNAHRCVKHTTMAVGLSLRKYGTRAHVFEVLHELPEDITQSVLDNYEAIYIDAFRNCGFDLMNIKEPGSSGRHAPETLKIMSEKRKTYKTSEATRLKISAALKGRPKPKGGKLSEEHRKKISLGNTGRKSTPKMIELLIARNKARTGFTPWNKGKGWSEETKRKMSESHKGKKLSPESIVKRNISRYGHSNLPPK